MLIANYFIFLVFPDHFDYDITKYLSMEIWYGSSEDFAKIPGGNPKEAQGGFETIARAEGSNGCLRRQDWNDPVEKNFRDEGVS